jgi:hypothetical protein
VTEDRWKPEPIRDDPGESEGGVRWYDWLLGIVTGGGIIALVVLLANQ